MPNPNSGPFSPLAPFAPAGGGGAWEAVSKTTLGAPTVNVDITGLDTTAELWLIRFRFWMATASDAAAMRVRSGGTFQTSAYRYHISRTRSNSGSYVGQVSDTDDRIRLPGNVASMVEGRSVEGHVLIHDPGNAVSRKHVEIHAGFFEQAGNNLFNLWGHGIWDGGAGAVDQFRFLDESVSPGGFATGSQFALFKRIDFV